jgi:peptidoglycan/xylan/chitin deacetylase (PgdA/CDA1 family)
MLRERWFKPLLFLAVITFITGCNIETVPVVPSVDPVETITLTSIPPTPFHPTVTPSPILTPTATITPTPVWVFQSGTITCPILLYHRIADPPLPGSAAARYYTAPADFKWQMQSLKDWGYTTIPISLLVDAIRKGASLPARPVVISFDDGDETVFQNAYPIMQSFGFTGVLYLVWNYIGATGYLTNDQILAMTITGWELGSHSMSHPHLPAVPDQVFYEATQSRTNLEQAFGVSVNTFAYPFGEMDEFVGSKIQEYKYTAAVGLGTEYIHNYYSLYYLSRIEVQNGTDLSAFAALLPWSARP